MKRIKTAVIGCGIISHAYVKNLKERFKILELVAFCDHTEVKAQAAADFCGGRVATIEEIIADDSIEIVLNLTTVPAHYGVIKQLLEGGKHVYTEKVLTATLEEASELLSLADKKNLLLGVAPDTFLGSAVQTARYVIESGLIGDVSSFVCSINRDGALMAEAFPFTAKKGGGIGFDVGIYYITALLNCFGPVSEVTGLMKTVNRTRQHISAENAGGKYTVEGEDLASGTLSFKNGVVGNVLFTSNSISLTPEQPVMTVYGTMGILYMADPNNFGGDVKVLLKGNDTPVTMPQTHGFRIESRGVGAAEMGWSLLKGRRPRANKEMAYHALEVLHGLNISGQTREFYKVASTFDITPPLPRGYLSYDGFISVEEGALAL